MVIALLWIFFRLLTSGFIAIISALHPMTPLEKSILLIPPSVPLSTWLERTFLSPWLRWDAVWYQRIVVHGYNAEDGTAQFHPLYPWLASLIAKLGVHPLFSLFLISSMASLGFLFFYHRLARLDLEDTDARVSLLVMLMAPTAFVLFAPYSEALFLLCAVVSLYFARKQHWWLSGIAGGFATLTRQQGLFLLLPLAYELWTEGGKTWKQLWFRGSKFISLAIIPISYLLWIGYRYFFIGEAILNQESWHSMIYSLFISSSAVEVVPQQTFTWPWKAIWILVHQLGTQPDWNTSVNTILTIIFLALFGLAWKKMRPSYRLYSLIIIIISFSYYTGSSHPYMGLPRHLLLAFPVFISAVHQINRPIIRPLYLFMLGMIYLLQILLYCLETWVA
jgi:hypothetical protein